MYSLVGAALMINGVPFVPDEYQFDVDSQWIFMQDAQVAYMIEISYNQYGWAVSATVTMQEV